MTKLKQSYNQTGIVSLLVVTVLIVLISLVSIGFSRLMNRTTREALDKQLGLQSYYAAESGLNDGINYVNNLIANGQGLSGTNAIKTCADDQTKLKPNLSGEATKPNAQYSCVLIDPDPPSLLYDIKASESKVFSFNQEDLTSLLISWQKKSTPNSYRPHDDSIDQCSGVPNNSVPCYARVGNWGGKTGVLKVSIYPIMLKTGTNPNTVTNNDWLDDRTATATYARSFFLYPDIGSPNDLSDPVANYYSDDGKTVTGECIDGGLYVSSLSFPGLNQSQAFGCNSVINCLPNAFTGPSGSRSLGTVQTQNLSCPARGAGYQAQRYYIKITSLYAENTVQVWGAGDKVVNPLSNTAVALSGAQAVIDSTGKGNDVLRRISAHIDTSGAANGGNPALASPDFAIRSSNTICKRIRVPAGGGPAFIASPDTTLIDCGL